MSHRMVHLFLIVGLLGFLNACGVAEGPAFLRIEGSVTDKEGIPVGGQEILLKLTPQYLNDPEKNSVDGQRFQTNATGQFAVEKSRFAGGMLIIPMALLVAPISGLVAAVTPWTFRDVQEFFSPVYLIGSPCLPHPLEINVVVGASDQAINFAEEEIRESLYRGKDRSHGKACTRVYDLGELKSLPVAASR